MGSSKQYWASNKEFIYDPSMIRRLILVTYRPTQQVYGSYTQNELVEVESDEELGR